MQDLTRIRLERAVFRAVIRLLGRGGSRDRAVLIAVPGGGNVGDQAMLDACVEGLGAPVDVVVRNSADLELPTGAREHVFANLVYGGIVLAAWESLRFARLVARAHTVIVMGADIMDGAYSDVASSRRFMLVDAASAVTDARVVGFSWNDHPKPRSLAMLRSLDTRVTLCVRDSESSERVARETAAPVLEVADLVFSLAPNDRVTTATAWIDSQHLEDRRVLAVNINALVERRRPHLELLRRESARLIDAGWSIVAVPHDRRNSPSDVSLSRELVGALPADRAFAADLYGPSGVRSIAARVDLVLTGRMHFAILALSCGTPAVAIAYQGKVAGLYRMLGLPEYVLEPGDDLDHQLTGAVRRIVGELPDVRRRIELALPELRRRSALNFRAEVSGGPLRQTASIS